MVGAYDNIIAEASRRYQVPPQYIRAVMQVESNGDPAAVSHKGAGGLMQIMPPTYEELRQKHGLGADRFDPRNNIMAGTAYLGQMFDQFGGDWNKALAAYNAGPGRVSSGRPLPAETRNYVPKVTSMIPQLNRPRPGQTVGYGAVPGNERELRGLFDQLDIPPERNQADGLGGLLNMGQTPTQPPRPGDPVGGQIDDLIGRLSRPAQRGPQLSSGQYQLAGAGAAVGQLAGVRDRKVGFGELLGALGGGLTRGTQAASQAAEQQRAAEFQELGNMSKLQGMQRSEATAQRQMQAANAYAAQIERINPGLAAALRNNPSLMDEIAKEQAKQQFAKDDSTPLVKNAIAAGLRPGTPEFNKFIQDNAASGTRISLNTAENHGAKALADDRIKQYSQIRTEGTTAGQLEKKLGQLETVLGEIGETGPATPQISALIGWAQQAGVPPEQINAFYRGVTGVNPADPAKVDIANKLVNDFVTSSIKTLGANPTDTDLATLQAGNPSITNQAEANRYIIQNILRPQLQRRRELWDRVRPLAREDSTLGGLDDEVARFDQEWTERNKPKDSPKAPQAAGSITDRYPDARQAPDGNYYVPDPDRPGKWARVKQ